MWRGIRLNFLLNKNTWVNFVFIKMWRQWWRQNSALNIESFPVHCILWLFLFNFLFFFCSARNTAESKWSIDINSIILNSGIRICDHSIDAKWLNLHVVSVIDIHGVHLRIFEGLVILPESSWWQANIIMIQNVLMQSKQPTSFYWLTDTRIRC